MNENDTYVGVDNGIGGGLAFYKPALNQLEVMPMPIIKAAKKGKGFTNSYNLPEIVDTIKSYPNIKIIIIELAWAFPGQGSVVPFSTGQTYGMIQGIVAALGIPYQIVSPKSWQKVMFEGVPQQDTKKASIMVAQRLFPKVRFQATIRSTKIHDGCTDAALMATYGYRMFR